MIVRNESRVILRCLESVRGLVDYVLVEDTGSTDGTQAIIRDWLARQGLPGEVFDEPWRDFAHNRTLALERLRKNEAIDYAFIMDADDFLVPWKGFDAAALKRDLSLDQYNVAMGGGGISYLRPLICSNRLPFRFRGILHEYLESPPGGVSIGTLGGFHVESTRDGARSRDPEKYRKDAATYERALPEETDPFLRARYTFYLAQSYRDCGEKEKATLAYLRRAELGYWDQEVFQSLYQAAKLREELGHDQDEVIGLYLRAAEAAPNRAEALHGACRLCRTAGRNSQGYEIGKRGLALRPPEGGLFVEHWIYAYGLRDEFAVNAYWAGHYEDSLAACIDLLASPLLPQAERERIAANATFAKDKLAKAADPARPDLTVWPAGAAPQAVPLAAPALGVRSGVAGLVSVITPTYQRARFLRSALRHFLSQDYPRCEWLILDDSPQKDAAFSAGLPGDDIAYFHSDRKLSIGEKRNHLVAKANGEFIIHFDDDDYYSPQYVSAMVSRLESLDADLVNLRGWFLYDLRSRFFGYWDLMQKAGLHYRCDQDGVALAMFGSEGEPSLKDNHFGFGFTYAYRKRIWDDVKFPALDWNEDGGFALAVNSRHRIDGMHDSDGLCLHYLHPGSTSRCFPQYRLPEAALRRLFPAVGLPEGASAAGARAREPAAGGGMSLDPPEMAA
jgi:glycosyltransferase involved in cell wall biosynthesis